jgi:hypothetical protein
MQLSLGMHLTPYRDEVLGYSCGLSIHKVNEELDTLVRFCNYAQFL